MKVGVVTFHNAHNYGASLQTWALQKVLKKQSHDARVIHYHPDIIDRLYDPRSKKNASIVERIKSLKIRKSVRNRYVRYEKYDRFIAEHFELEGDYRTYQELERAELSFDVYITGSDQVWNPEHVGGYDPAYFLEFAKGDAKRISYAASVGNREESEKYQDDFIRALSKFDVISVREESAKPFIEGMVKTPVHVVLDPTLLLQKEDYDEIKTKYQPKEKYILVYMMEDNKELIRMANRISKEVGLPITQRKQRKYFENEIENFYFGLPGDFLNLVENAEYVITNSFHGTVFSLIYKKKFVSMLHTTTGSRTHDMLKILGEENHLLYSEKDFDGFHRFYIEDEEKLDRRMNELREQSLSFLNNALM